MASLTLLRTLFLNSPWTCCFVRVSIGAIFVIAGAIKIVDPRTFAHIISAYGLLPEELLVPVAIGVPAIELVAGLGLLFNVRGSLTTICALLVVFLSVLGYAIWENIKVDCGCFSQLEIETGKNLYKAFMRDLGLMVASFYLMAWRRILSRSRAE